ncbi:MULTISPECIES: hypothetical protein [Leptotrichia]|uniref:hypothetical protein n=1 Tax=Leptotrichia TaxID=32067 RepID=UPI0003AD8EC1|nr:MULTISPECIES: hypothetical protein [Leptotrichia]ERL27340.1 hypothetical protein HMPREF9108_00083 [Leptotrichia sp. oral taxon 225 str. F0581]WLD73559.1 hypothetical protein QU666_07920 [Leptotrichia sp. HMT-225]
MNKFYLPLPVIILIFYIVYTVFAITMRKIKFNVENLEELDGEFIFTFIKRIKKKEIYFNIDEVKICLLTRILIQKGTFRTINFNIYLNDGYSLRLRKKRECLLFLQVCREKREDLYQKILSMIPAETTVVSIIEKELDNFKR